MSRLPRQVKLFGAVSLFNDFASEMVYPLLPAFVTMVLGAGPAALGALDGAADFAASAVKLGAGRLADRPRRRGPLVVLGYAVAVAVRPLVALTGAAWQVIGLRVTDRLGKGVRTPPRDAIIADATPPALYGRAFGVQRGLDHLGAVLGPLAAWWLLSSGTLGVRGVIAASVVPGLLVLVLAVVAVRAAARGEATVDEGAVDKAAVSEAAVGPTAVSPSAVSPAAVSPPAVFLVAAFYLVRLPEALLILRAQDLGIGIAQVTLLWAALHVVRSGSSFLGGILSDRAGTGRALALGWAGYAALAAAFALADGWGQAWAVFLALGLVAGLIEAPERALVSRLGGARMGSAFGSFHALTGIAALAGGVGLGVVYAAWGGATALAVSAAGAVALVALWSSFTSSTVSAVSA